MKVHSAGLIISAASPGQFPEAGVPEIAIVGRSNVGKSSLINCITQRKKLAITSSTPGRTRLINFFLINGQLRLVDLPGYGFAKASKPEREKWKKLIAAYLESDDRPDAVIVIMDSRHDASPLDLQMIETLADLELPAIAVFTKVDKVKKNKLAAQVRNLEQAFELPEGGAVLFSATTGAGRDDLWALISEASGIPLGTLAKNMLKA